MIYGQLVSDIYISAESINKLSTYLRENQYLDEATGSDLLAKYNNFCMKSSLALGLNVSELKTCADDIAQMIRKEGLNKRTIEFIQIRSQEMYQKMADNITKNIDTFKTDKRFIGLDPAKLSQAWHITMYICLVNVLFSLIAVLLFGPNAGSILTACICAPISEETGKHIAAKGGFAKEFMVVFNAVEFTEYVTTYASAVGLGRIITTRLMCIAFHVNLQIIHWLTNNKKVQQALGLNKDSDKAQLAILGKTTAMIIHSLWNIVASIA